MDRDSTGASDQSSEQSQHMSRRNSYFDQVTVHPEWRPASSTSSPSPPASTRRHPLDTLLDSMDFESSMRRLYLSLPLGDSRLFYVPPQTYGTLSSSTSQYTRSSHSQEDDDDADEEEGGGGGDEDDQRQRDDRWCLWASVFLLHMTLVGLVVLVVLYFTVFADTTDVSQS